MSITIQPETEAKPREKAEREGMDLHSLADAMLREVLAWEEQDRQEAAEGIRRGLEASDAGRARPFGEFAAEVRARYTLPVHLSDEELRAAV